MTEYHPVTKELHCNHECICESKHPWNSDKPCDDDLCEYNTRARPDPLALLEAWVLNGNERPQEGVYLEISGDGGLLDFIKLLRTNPEAVRQRGIKEEWWKE